jgi:glycosyltransferase involved in cell wall biosynthesis
MPSEIIHIPRRFVSHEWGGTETVITEIAKQQQRAGYTPRIVTSRALSNQARETIDGIPVERHRYCYPFFGLSRQDKAAMDKKGGNLLSFSLFASLACASKARLFHAHALKRLGGTVARAAQLQRKPFVVSLHGGVYDVPAAELATMTRPLEGKFEWGRAFGALLGSRQLLNRADMVICVGQSEYETALQHLPHDRIAYLPNGVNFEKFSQGDGARFRAQQGIKPNAFMVLNVSRIDSQKNQQALIEAFSHVHRRDPSAVLVLIGPETQPSYAQRLREMIGVLGLSYAVKWLPGLAPSDPTLVDAYDACDAFVLPSMHEPFGIVVLEAWSAGKPVIASRVGGLKALISSEETGLFFETPSELTVELLSLHRSVELRNALGNAGRAQARQHYDWAQINRQLETLYQAAEAHAEKRYHRSLVNLSSCPA